MKKDISRFFTITKRNDEERVVEGYCSTEALDHDGEIVKISAMREAWDEYMEYASLREMHQPSAVGKVMTGTFDDKGCYISAKVVDPVAWEKVREGVYKGFSIGGKKLLKSGNEIHRLRLGEISLVDRPNNSEAQIELFKFEGAGDEYDFEAMKKGSMGIVADFAYTLSSLRRLKNEVEFEHGPSSDLAAGFTKLLGTAGRLLKKVTAEATASLAKGDGTMTEEEMKKAHQPAAELVIKVVTENGGTQAPAGDPPAADPPAADPPADPPPAADPPAGDPPADAPASEEAVQKMLDARDEKLEKRWGEKLEKLDALENENAALREKLVKLEGTPAPMKGVKAGGTTVTKEEDTGGEDLNKINDDDDPETMMRKIHAQGGTAFDNRNRPIS